MAFICKSQLSGNLAAGKCAVGQALFHQFYFVLGDVVLQAFTCQLTEVFTYIIGKEVKMRRQVIYPQLIRITDMLAYMHQHPVDQRFCFCSRRCGFHVIRYVAGQYIEDKGYKMLQVLFVVGALLFILPYHLLYQCGHRHAISRLLDQQLLEADMMGEDMLQLLKPLGDPFALLHIFVLFQEDFRKTDGTKAGGLFSVKSATVHVSEKKDASLMIRELILVHDTHPFTIQHLYDLEEMRDERALVPAFHIRYKQFKRPV